MSPTNDVRLKLENEHAGTQATEIVPGDVSGGTNTSHTILFDALVAVLDAWR